MDPRPATDGTPPGLLLRACAPGDAAALAALMNLPGVRHGTLRLPFHSEAEARARIEARPADDRSIVAELDGTLVGEIGLQRFRGRRAHAAGIGMMVHDDWTGRRIGTALLGAAIDVADRWLGLRRLELTVYPDNTAAIALYRRAGFVEEGRHRAYAFRDGGFVDALSMARMAGGGSVNG